MMNCHLFKASNLEGAIAEDEGATNSQADEASSESDDVQRETKDTEVHSLPPPIEVLRQLSIIGRYERGARSRRRRAIGAFLMFQPIA
jgi:hypothetical protein